MQKNDGALTFLGLIISAILVVALVFTFAKTFPDNQLSVDAQQYLLESMESTSDDASGADDGHEEGSDDHDEGDVAADEHGEGGDDAEHESGD